MHAMSQALPLPVHHASRRLHRMINGKVTNILYLFLTFMGKKKIEKSIKSKK
jgi:hypothetical protein